MAGSTFGKAFTVTTFGESHGAAIGCIVDGCPAGLELCESDIQYYLDMRRPGGGDLATPRKEADEVSILSGVFDGKTTGAPICLMMHNTSQRSKDYSKIAEVYRPGHADYTFDKKYGFRDYRGGGRSSGRETAARTAAGAVAIKFLKELGISIDSKVIRLGGHVLQEGEPVSAQNIEGFDSADSYGGVIECVAKGLPVGLGETVFDKLDGLVAQAVMSIGAVKGVEIGDGFAAADAKGSENNDSFIADENGITKKTNHSGGTLGGMSDGSDLVVRAAFKPTPSIGLSQETVNRDGEKTEIEIGGRHDVSIVSRAPVVVTSMVALVLADLVIRNMGARMDHVRKVYCK